MNGAQKKQLTDAAERNVLAEVERRAEAIIKNHRGVNPMADYGATEVLVALRAVRRERGLGE